MGADGLALLERLDSLKGDARADLIARIDRCAWYARLDRKVNKISLAVLMKRDKINAETVMVQLLAKILDELT